MKLTLDHRNRNSYQRDIQTLIHRNEPNRPHISSVIYQCQRATPSGQNKQMRQSLSAPACLILKDASVSPERL
ncbi:hypothetical protein, partial [Phaeobacter gallaeciensis]|uniref:hypothetical protein n=1 Tax=Phaeobacter gallaeciensis TaxID=60890 RepID=UPI00237F82D1